MSLFKDIVNSDISETFLNADEFSDMHSVNGKQMKVQIDNNEQLAREMRLNERMDGIYVKQMLIYLSAADYGPLPKQNTIINFDGSLYKVKYAIDEMGIYSIMLEANRA